MARYLQGHIIYAYANNTSSGKTDVQFRNDKETYADCAIRETYEETGIHIKLKNNMVRVKIRNTYYFIYIMKEISNIFIPIDKKEIYKVKWWNVKDLSFNKINVETKLFLKRKYNFVKNL